MKLKVWIAAILILVLGTSIPFAAGAEEQKLLGITVERPALTASYVGSNISNMSEKRRSELRETITEGLLACQTKIDISSYLIPAGQVNVDAIAEMIFYEIPEGFHFSGGSFEYGPAGTLTKLHAVYSLSKGEYTAMMKEINKAADAMTADLAKLGEVEKALLLHDRLALHAEYAYAELQDGTIYDDENHFNMYGALVGRRTVCQGYSMAYMYLLRKVGIKNRLCISTEMNHAWNIVTIGGKEYHVDVTFDDPVEDVTGQVYHANFLRSSAGLYSTGHDASDYDTTPTDTTYDDYFWQDSMAAFTLLDNEIYYIDSMEHAIKRYADRSVFLEMDQWLDYGISFARLATDGTHLLYSTPKSICGIDPTLGGSFEVARPALPLPTFAVFGFALEEDTLIIDRFTSPYFNSNTKSQFQLKLSYTDPGPGMETVILLLQYLTGQSVSVDMNVADSNSDGQLTVIDAVLLLHSLAA